ncbi:XRE family transcriptional regulator [Amycolatopsis carbonis]|uniref:XRE family transcriptional regulator n=1 Tax=Amycolatopsis carbonis TaxID=715471 RepID=A0A9Y2IA90_9PSEU|nr:XRE family transcriptional regulator [Amycolatopsis sp. 2-15]WIX75874.1 XRE family transcriptional regulator [Amycolatopsis sp. 2-15]
MSAQHPGSFAVTLDAAIEDSGLSLDRVRHHLATRGVTLSRSALSYWRRGRSQPERETSLNAVTQLEAVLELSPGSLTSLLGPRAPRGRWLGHPPDRVERRRLWPDLRPLTVELKPPPDEQLAFWSVHDRVAVDDDGCERALHVRVVAEATMDGVDRMMTYHQADGPLPAEPRYQGVRFARVGRVRVDRRTGMTAGELLLDRVLAAGEVTAVEYEILLPPGTPTQGVRPALHAAGARARVPGAVRPAAAAAGPLVRTPRPRRAPPHRRSAARRHDPRRHLRHPRRAARHSRRVLDVVTPIL